MTTTNRRDFLRTSTESAAVAAALTALGPVHSSAAPPEQRVQLGIVGCGGIMGHHVRGLVSRKENVAFAWLCDIDPRQINEKAKTIDGFQRSAPKQTSRFDDVAADPNVDAVIIADAYLSSRRRLSTSDTGGQ